jgi:hypothetical protein
MATVTWQKTRTKGVYRRDGVRGRHYRHVYRDALADRLRAARNEHSPTPRLISAEMLNNRPHDVTTGRITLQDAYDALRSDPRAGYSPATKALHSSLWEGSAEFSPVASQEAAQGHRHPHTEGRAQ